MPKKVSGGLADLAIFVQDGEKPKSMAASSVPLRPESPRNTELINTRFEAWPRRCKHIDPGRSMQARSIGHSLGLSLAGSINWDKASEVEKPVELDRSRPLERPKAAKVARSWLERATQSSLSTGSVEPDARASSKRPSGKVDRAPARVHSLSPLSWAGLIRCQQAAGAVERARQGRRGR